MKVSSERHILFLLEMLLWSIIQVKSALYLINTDSSIILFHFRNDFANSFDKKVQ